MIKDFFIYLFIYFISKDAAQGQKQKGRRSVATYTVAIPPRAIRERTRYRPSTRRPISGSVRWLVLTLRVYGAAAVSPSSGAPRIARYPRSAECGEPGVSGLLPLCVSIGVGGDLHGLRGIGEGQILPAGDLEQTARRAAIGVVGAAEEGAGGAFGVAHLLDRAPSRRRSLLEQSMRRLVRDAGSGTPSS